MVKLLVGLLKGAVIGGAVGYGAFALGDATGFSNGWLTYGVVGMLVGLLVGRPLWSLIRDKSATTWVGVLKAAFGFGIGCGLYAIIAKAWGPSDDVLKIAGHGAYAETADAGRTWTPVPNDLPGLDLHALVVDPADPAHAWAYAVGFGLFESTDRGRHWVQRQLGDWPVLVVTRLSGTATLIGLSVNGLGASTDGGRTWRSLALPGGQLASLAAVADGSVLQAGTTSGLERSVDGGTSWQPTAFSRIAVTVAIAPSDPQLIAVVDEATRFFRSDDGGTTWPGPR